jgi:DNA-binding NarL/FixJ family response regulator
MKKTKLLIADDNAAFRRRLGEFLQEYGDMEVIGEACNGKEAVSKVEELQPDLVLMDVRMPDMNGMNAITVLNALPAPPKVIVLTVFDCLEYRLSAEAAGAEGYVVKAALADELVPAIRAQAELKRGMSFKSKQKGRNGRGRIQIRLKRTKRARRDDR